ncbi:hypothetical protein ACO0LF_12750 [Undibacterium sp. Di27W]|uniref:hypothetical protein n=1 Tax=Undibacterium sp. Di27W TaxID=3413036 RepID=UPI003BF1A0B1
MKPYKIFAVMLFLFTLSTSSTAVFARPHGYRTHSRVSIGVAIPPLYFHYGNRYGYAASYYPYDYSWRYYPSVVIAPSVTYTVPVTSTSNTVYVDTYQQGYVEDNNNASQNYPRQQSTTGRDWLYCHQPDGFYPAIKACPGGWQRVPAQSR